MTKLLGNWLKIYEEEIGLFLWAALLLFLIHSSNILFNNFAETAFLKRFGVRYMPIMTAVNAVTTFFIMGVLAGFMMRMSGTRLLAAMLLISGISAAVLRILIPLEIRLLYPVLYVLKAQYEALLGLLFWNLANDLFDTRQSKRMFPLISAGGIIGGILGSFGTPYLAKLISLDNLMLAYFACCVAGALVARRMGVLYPVEILSQGRKRGGKRLSMVEELRNIVPLVKTSALAKGLILLTLLPNIVIPVMNYQFSFAVDQTFGTEGALLTFFGYFRGVQNIIALVISLFVGRIYNRFGIPVALMFHPVNYTLAFLGFLFRFDIFSAMYARLSTAVLRNTINTPARAVLMGLIPPSFRAVLRPFLRGTMVRMGILAGSGLILLSQPFLEPRYLSLAGIVVVAAWIASVIALRRNYAGILTDLIATDTVDLKSLEKQDLARMLREPKVRDGLLRAFPSASGQEALWYGRLLASSGIEGLDDILLSKLEQGDGSTAALLLPLLSPQGGKEAVRRYMERAEPGNPAAIVAFASRAREAFSERGVDFHHIVFEKEPAAGVKTYAVAGLYPGEFGSVIRSWLHSKRTPERQAAIVAGGGSGDIRYIRAFTEILRDDPDRSLVPFLLPALFRLGAPDLNDLARPFLWHPSEQVRAAALGVFAVSDEAAARSVVLCLGDASDRVRDAAIEKLEQTAQRIAPLLVEALMLPGKRMRDSLFRVAETLQIKDIEVLRFARAHLKKAYDMAAAASALRRFPQSPGRDLLVDYLEQQKALCAENVLRVLAARDRSGRLRIVWRGIASTEPQLRANSIEALDDLTDKALSAILIPLLENRSSEECWAVGKRHFKRTDPAYGTDTVLSLLLREKDRLKVVLTLHFVAERGASEAERGIIQDLTGSSDPIVAEAAGWASGLAQVGVPPDVVVPPAIAMLRMIDRLRDSQVFSSLTVNELAAVASATEERTYPAGAIVVEGDRPWREMFLVEAGEIRVSGRPSEDGLQVDQRRFGPGEAFGILAFFLKDPPGAEARTRTESRLLRIGHPAFERILLEYPAIAIEVSRLLSRRLRTGDDLLRQRGGIP